MEKPIKKIDEAVDVFPKPFSTETDLKNTFVSILDGHEEFVVSIDGNILGSNLEAVNLTGYEEWEIIGKNISIFYLPEEVGSSNHLEHLRKAESEGNVIFEGWKLKKRGVKFFARLRFLSKRNHLGELTGFRMVISDITHKVVYNGKLSKIREKYLSIYNNAFVGIVTASSEDFHTIHCNSKAKEILGERSENLRAAFEHNSEFDSFKSQLFRNGVIKGFEFKSKLANGQEKWISFDCRLHGEENTIEGVIVDVTNLKSQELEITKLQREVNTFIYHASHELRSPMTTILGILNLISLERKNDEVVDNYVNLIKERVKSQDQLLKDLTGVIYNNTSPVCIEDFKVEDELNDIVSGFIEIYPMVVIHMNIYVESPIKTDTLRLRAALRNILSNAFKYNSKISPRIDIAVVSDRSRVKFVIKDFGIGMSDDQVLMIFNLFHRSNEGYPGNGLGLYLVKSIMTKLSGDIKIKSKVGEGTEVSLIL